MKSREAVLHPIGMPALRKDGSQENVNCTKDWKDVAYCGRSQK